MSSAKSSRHIEFSVSAQHLIEGFSTEILTRLSAMGFGDFTGWNIASNTRTLIPLILTKGEEKPEKVKKGVVAKSGKKKELREGDGLRGVSGTNQA